MRLMDDKGRLFGKINIFDLLVLLLVIVGVVGMSLRLASNRQELGETKTAVYQLEIKEGQECLKDAFQVGDALYEKDTLLGTITEVRVENAGTLRLLPDGTAKMVEYLHLYDIEITFTTDQLMEDKGYHIDAAEWLAGTTHSISNGFAATSAVVRSVEIQ